MGWAHSVEVWRTNAFDAELVGGLYGIRIGGLFAGESMFHRVTDASKVACWATVELLRLDGATLFDVQWTTPHLESLGAVDVVEGRVPLASPVTARRVGSAYGPGASPEARHLRARRTGDRGPRL